MSSVSNWANDLNQYYTVKIWCSLLPIFIGKFPTSLSHLPMCAHYTYLSEIIFSLFHIYYNTFGGRLKSYSFVRSKVGRYSGREGARYEGIFVGEHRAPKSILIFISKRFSRRVCSTFLLLLISNRARNYSRETRCFRSGSYHPKLDLEIVS